MSLLFSIYESYCRFCDKEHNFVGENGAGKTSLLNLLLGRDVLPDVLPTAATLQYGDIPRFDVHYKGATITLLADNETDDHMRQRLQDKVNRQGCKRVNIFWPIPWLQVKHPIQCILSALVYSSYSLLSNFTVNKNYCSYTYFIAVFLYIHRTN